MKVLIIGGTRRSGPYLVKELVEDGHEVTIYHRGQSRVGFTDKAIEIHGDRKDHPRFQEQMQRLHIDAVVDMIATNASDVRAVVDTFRGRIQRYLVVSSYEAYDAFAAAWERRFSHQPVPIPEDAPLRAPGIVYGHSPDYEKIPMEQAALEAQHTERFPCTIVRFPALYGPRDGTPREWYYVRQALDRRPWAAVAGLGQSLFTRGYLVNMAHALVCLLRHPQTDGAIFNAADELALTNGQIITLVGEILGNRWEIVSLPRDLMPPFEKSQALPYSPDPYDIEPHLLLDVQKIRTQAGYRDAVPVHQALEDTVLWLRDHPSSPDFMPVDYGALDRARKRLDGITG